MTREQLERWKDFSLRLVNLIRSEGDVEPSRKDVADNIEFFFDCRLGQDSDDGAWTLVIDWDNSITREPKPYPSYFEMCVGDHISDLAQCFIPNYWSIDVQDDDDAYEKAREQWVDPVHTCVRAGLDVAVAPSAGVCGFSAGDIRKMYPDGVPDWVKEFFVPAPLVAMHPTNTEGIFIPEVGEMDYRAFDELPDDQGVWL